MSRAARTLSFVIALLVAATAAASGMFALGKAAHPESVAVKLSVITALGNGLQTIRRLGRSPAHVSVAFLGDSTAISYPDGSSVHEYLGKALLTQWPDDGAIRVESLSSLGMTPAGYYLVQDMITDAHPDIAVLTVNLALIRSPLPPHLQRPQLAGWVRADRMYETLVGLDMHQYGVTADRLLLYKSFVAAKQTGAWFYQSQNQVRLGHLRDAVASAVAAKTGWSGAPAHRRRRLLGDQARRLRADAPGGRPRFTKDGAIEALGEVLAGIDADHWVVEVIDAVLRGFARSGTATVVYVSPINVEELRSLGVYDEAGIGRTLTTLEAVARANGAEFADLHDLLPDTAFRDTGGHFTHEPPYVGPQLVAEALAPYVTVQAREVANSR